MPDSDPNRPPAGAVEWANLPVEADRPVGILLVDDHRENLTALQAVLEPLGERLVTAGSGEQALRVLLREEIAVILLDVRMAGLDGLETARIIRARPGTRHIPIIFLTAQTSEIDEVVLAYSTGAVDYVVKPFEADILRAKVSVFVDLHRERSERVRQSHARAEAEAVARTIRTLQILSDAALAHMDMDGLAAELLERTATLFRADGTALLLRDENAPGLILHASRGEALPVAVPDEIRVTVGEGPLGRIAAGRRPALLGDEDRDPGRADPGDDPGGEDPGDRSGAANLAVVPLVTGDDVLGLLLLGASAPRRFDTSDLELLGLAADRMALAIDHVQRFDHERRLVETLQRSLLPDRLPHHPRLELAARYLPSGLAPQIGGDWYDALELDADHVVVMIGDVVGHGVRAATTMSVLRNALRAFAIEGHRPGSALHQLDRVVHATLGSGMIATVLFVLIDAGSGTLTLARAGHPPPALRSPDGRVRFLETEPGLPMGIDTRVTATETEYPIAPGETLLLFTDGLVERRQEDISAGLGRLSETLAAGPAGVEQLCDHVLAGTVGVEATHDDVAMLAVRFLSPAAGVLELTLPAQADSVTLARHRVRAWLMACVPELDAGGRADLELGCSEACSNVVRHAYGPVDATFGLTVGVSGGVVELRIADSGRWRPARGRDGGRGLSLMRQICDELLVDQRPDGTTVTMRRQLSTVPTTALSPTS